MLTRNIRTQIDRGRGAPILQNSPIYPASQPTATPRTSFGHRGLRGWRQQPNNHVALASTTGESSQRLPKCTNCLQLGHEAQTCPRLHTDQPPTQVSPLHIFHGNHPEDLTILAARPPPCVVQPPTRIPGIENPNHAENSQRRSYSSPKFKSPCDAKGPQ